MIILNTGSGSREITLLHPVADHKQWLALRTNAARFMRSRGYKRASELLESIPFDIVAATNSFNDDFEILIVNVPPEEYAVYEERAKTRWERPSFDRIAEAISKLGKHAIRFVVVDVAFDQQQPVATPEPRITSAVVQAALGDAEQLIRYRGSGNALDRLHTVFHGYLRAVCRDATITFEEQDTVQTLLKKLRTEHRKLAVIGSDPNVTRIFGSIANILDALNTIRNQHSLAHPNELLMGEPEAMLIVNSTRSILNFLDAKLAT
jgi:hypothetical protein